MFFQDVLSKLLCLLRKLPFFDSCFHNVCIPMWVHLGLQTNWCPADMKHDLATVLDMGGVLF